MAGTGHRYEISNPTAVTEFTARMQGVALARELHEAFKWLTSRHFRKYLTGELFSFRLKPSHVINSSIPDERREYIVTKVVAGDEVRRFDPVLFETLGPDLSHILDWIAELKRTEDPLYMKVARMETQVLSAKADAWTKRLNSRAIAFGGAAEAVLSVSSELTWFELKDAHALGYEGSMMSHCVGGHGYAEMVDSGKTRIFSLRKDMTKPILTAEIRTDHRGPTLIQIQRRGNGGLPVAYCDAAVSLLNAVGAQDIHETARRYALVNKYGRWSTIFDSWDGLSLMGRTALSDGRSLMFMSVRDASKPLLVVEYALGPQSPERWFTGEFEPLMVRIKQADDMVPHYDDQVEACEIANHFVRGNIETARGFGLSWMGNDDAGRLVPQVDTYEQVEMPGWFFYRENRGGDTAACYLPHSGDPARLLMVAEKVKHDIEATVLPGQRISRAETGRCLDFLTATKTMWLAYETAEAREANAEFRKLCEPMLVLGTREWRSFVADRKEVPAIKTAGQWHETDYLLRYLPSAFRSIDIHIEGKTVTALSGYEGDKKDLVEIVTKLRQKRLTSDKFLNLSALGRKKGDAPAIFMCGGKWVWSNDGQKLMSLAQQALEDPEDVSEAVLSDLLANSNALLQQGDLKSWDAVQKIKSRLLPIWFMRVSSFETCAVRRGGFWSALNDVAHYPLIDRLADLADEGFELDSRQSRSQFKKALARLSKAYGRRADVWTETEFTEFTVRWYRHLPKKYMNMVSSYWLPCPTWLAKPDVAGRLLDILADEGTLKTKFRDAAWSQAEKTLDAADYTSMDARDLANHAKLFHRVSKSRYLYGRNLIALESLVGQLSEGPTEPDVPLEELRDIYAKYSSKAA
jgi:hypothetical protein